MDFLKNYWYVICACITAVSLLFNVILLIKKGVPFRKILKFMKMVPTLINTAEKLFPLSNMGADKRQYFIDMCDELISYYGIEKYRKYIDVNSLLEDYLATPEKKVKEVI